MRNLAPFFALLTVFSAATAFGQQNSLNNTNVQGTGAAGATLSSRFDSDFSRFQTGSTDASGVIGSGATAAGLTNTAANNAGAGGAGRVGGAGGLGGFGGGGLGGFGFGGLGTFAAAGGFNRQGQQTGQTTQQTIRTKLVLGFPSRLPTTPIIATRLTDRINRVSRISKNSPIKIVMVGQTAVLQGTVATEHDRNLAARYASLEPGVRQVENRLTVSQLPEELPAGPLAPPSR